MGNSNVEEEVEGVLQEEGEEEDEEDEEEEEYVEPELVTPNKYKNLNKRIKWVELNADTDTSRTIPIYSSSQPFVTRVKEPVT